MMQSFCHRNIARLFTSYTDSNGLKFITIMEMCHGDLKMYIESRNYVPLPVDTILDWCSQMACGLKYLHDKGIIHRDLKPAVNVLLRNHFSSDFISNTYFISEYPDGRCCFENYRF